VAALRSTALSLPLVLPAILFPLLPLIDSSMERRTDVPRI
jgi:hypothetical protein